MKRFVKSEYLSIRRSLRNGHHRRTCSERCISMSIKAMHSLSHGASNSNSPCGPAMKLLPQNCIPLVIPDGSFSSPTLLTEITGNPLAMACPRCEIIHACRWRCFSSSLSELSHPIAVGYISISAVSYTHLTLPTTPYV